MLMFDRLHQQDEEKNLPRALAAGRYAQGAAGRLLPKTHYQTQTHAAAKHMNAPGMTEEPLHHATATMITVGVSVVGTQRLA